MKVVWSQRAVLDVEHIRDYIARDAPGYAGPFVQRLLHATRHLAQFPQSGRSMPEAGSPDIREVIYQGYRIIYRLLPGVVEIVTVVHGGRNLHELQNKPWTET